jgi:hypothetical protein
MKGLFGAAVIAAVSVGRGFGGVQLEGQRVAAIRPAMCTSLDAGKSRGQRCGRLAGCDQGCFGGCSTMQASSWAVIEDSASDQPASTTPRDTTRSVQAAHLHPPTPCAAPPFALLCCSHAAAAINPHRSLSPPGAGSPFRELSRITAPPASRVRLTFTPLLPSYLYACLRCMALSFNPHPLARFCMLSQ